MGIPYQLLHHRFPNLARAKVFGCLGQIWVHPQHRRKLQEQAQWGVCLGVPSHTKGWEFYLPATREVGHVSRNVVFHENLSIQDYHNFSSSPSSASHKPLTAGDHEVGAIDPFPATLFDGAERIPSPHGGDEAESSHTAPFSPPPLNMDMPSSPHAGTEAVEIMGEIPSPIIPEEPILSPHQSPIASSPSSKASDNDSSPQQLHLSPPPSPGRPTRTTRAPLRLSPSMTGQHHNFK